MKTTCLTAVFALFFFSAAFAQDPQKKGASKPQPAAQTTTAAPAPAQKPATATTASPASSSTSTASGKPSSMRPSHGTSQKKVNKMPKMNSTATQSTAGGK